MKKRNFSIKRRGGSFRAFLTAMMIGTFLVAVTAAGVGRYHIDPVTVMKILISKFVNISATWDMQAESVIWTLRLPRIITAILVGSALSLSGAAYQGVFKNPLVAPDMLGVSSGACVGASMAILFSGNTIIVQLAAFAGGILAVSIANLIPKVVRNSSMMTLVLAGVIITGFMNSILGLLKYLADPETQLASITHWQLGSLADSVWRDVIWVGPPIVVAAGILLILRWRLNLLSLGEQEAKTLGVNIGKTRGLIIICATILTASAVCISGTIGWIGLVIPHFSRMITGADNCRVIPISAVMGAAFLLIVDTLARVLTSAELPLSILTGLIGAPFYFYLLLKQRMDLS